MSSNIINHVLKSEVKDLIKNIDNLIIEKGDISGNSIEVENKITQSKSSYVYYDNNKHRDNDFEELLKLITEKTNG